MRRHTTRRLSDLRCLFVGIILATGLAEAPAAFAEVKDLKYSIMVGKFENRSGFAGWVRLSGAWGAILTDKLNQTGRFIVVGEPGMREEAMKEQGFVGSGATAQGKLAPARGQMTPAQLLVKGVITDLQTNSSTGGGGLSVRGVGVRMRKESTEIHATLYIVDASTGSVVASKSVMGEAVARRRSLSLRRDGVNSDVSQADNDNIKTAMADALEKAVNWMASDVGSLPWRGSIVAIAGDQIYIDRGSREGVSTGMKMTVGESQIIRSPDTGEVLDEIVTERARVEIVRVKDKVSICKVVSGDPTILSEGMGVVPTSL